MNFILFDGCFFNFDLIFLIFRLDPDPEDNFQNWAIRIDWGKGASTEYFTTKMERDDRFSRLLTLLRAKE